MVAIYVGSGYGLDRSSIKLLGGQGQIGDAGLGREGLGAYVNAATGGLALQRADEILLGKGPDEVVGSEYDSSGPNWFNTSYRFVFALTGTVNTAGSTITRGSNFNDRTVFTYDAARGAYLSKEGAGAYDEIKFDGTAWSFKDGDTQIVEYYEQCPAAGAYFISRRVDLDGNTQSFTYVSSTSGTMSRITEADGSYMEVDFGANNRISDYKTTYVNASAATVSLTRVRYTYDTSDRITKLTVDLSPEDNSITDGNVYVTNYSYDGTSQRIASISQTDGSRLDISYDGSGRVASYTQTVADGVTRTTSFDYSVAGRTTVTDPAGQKTILFYDGNKNLTQISYPGIDSNTAPRVVQFAYNSNGDVISVTHGPGDVTVYDYDANGNRILERDSAGNTVIRTYGNRNELLTETHTVDWSPTVPTSSFEAPTTATWTYNPTVSGASFTGLAGVGSTDYSGFAFAVAPDGHQVGFVQSAPGYTPGAIAQTIDGLVAGQSYVASFYVAARSNGGNPLTVTFDGVTIASVMPSSTSFELLTVGFVANGTTGTLTFAGAASASNLTTAIDQVKVALVTETTRFAYDSEDHLRYTIGALGEVTQYTYDTPGNMTSALVLAGSTYSLSGIDPKTSIGASTLDTWASGISDKSGAQRTDTAYYSNGAINTVTSYSKLLTSGAFDTNSELSQTTYVYDSAGNLLSRHNNASSANEVFVYDGLGRQTMSTDFNGNVTRTSFLDASGQTVLTHADGLSEISTYDKAGELISFSQSNAGGNLVDLSGWPGNPSSVPSGQAIVANWYNPTAYTDETQWSATTGPNGLPVVAMRAGQLDATAEGGGNFTNATAIDPSKAYEFTYYFKFSDLNKHSIYFGLSAFGPTAWVEDAVTGSDDSNPYFYAASAAYESSVFTADKWYKVVGYVLPQGTAATAGLLGGVYDAATGQKVDNVATFRWNPERPSNSAYARFFDFYGEANQLYSTYFYQPEIRQVSTPTVTGPDQSTSLYRYDNLGRLRMTVDPTGRRAYMMYDNIGRKVADIDADGSVIEYRYDGNDNLTSTTRYATRLTSTQLASLIDAGGNPTTSSFASLRPAPNAADQWTFQVYDFAQRLVQTIDGTGATTVYTYDGASRVTSTTTYANRLTSTQLASLKAEAIAPNYWLNADDPSLWYASGLSRASAGSIDGSSAYQFTITSTSWQGFYNDGLAASAGDTISTTISMKAVGTVTTNSFGIYGTSYGWGDNASATALVVSGPGSITQNVGGIFNISGLSTSDATRITITRKMTQAETSLAIFYVNNPSSAVTLGQATIAAAPVFVRDRHAPTLPTADSANDRVTRSFYDADGRVIAAMDAAGGLSEFVYDKAGRKITEIAYANPVAQSHRAGDTLSQLKTNAGTSASDRRADYVYDARGLLRYTLDAAAHPVEHVYDAAGRVIRTVDYAGSIAAASSYSLAYVQAQLSSTGLSTNGSNRISRTVYDAAGQAAFSIDPTGAVNGFTYDTVGNVIKTVGYATAYTTAGDQSLATMQTWASSHASDSGNRLSRAVYDLLGRVAYTVDAEGYVVEHQYDQAGRLAKDFSYIDIYTVADGVTKESLAAQIGTLPSTAVVVTYGYDADGLLSDVTNGVGAVTHYAYDAFGQLTDTIVAYGTSDASTLHRSYDVAGRVASETHAYGASVAATTSYGYDAVGNLLTVTDPRGYTTTRTYDMAGRVLTVTVPVDATSANDLVTTNEYDAFGDLVKVTDALLNSSFNYYDALGRVTLQSDAEGFITQTSYNAFGEVYQVTRRAARGTGTPTVTAPPTVVTGAGDATTTFAYDKMGRVATVTDAEGYSESYVYNTFGERYVVYNKIGGWTAYIYDRLGQLYYSYQPVPSYRADGTVELSIVYNPLYVRDFAGRVADKVEGYGLTERRDTYYYYDKAGHPITIVHSPVQITASDLSTVTTYAPYESYAYNLRGDLIQSADANGYRTLYWYDALGRKTAEVSPVGTLSAWTYDGNGNVATTRVYETPVSIPGTPGGSPPSPGSSPYRETLYAYDRANRLITTTVASLKSGSYSGSAYTLATSDIVTSLTYDKNGNVVKETDGAGNILWSYFDKLDRKVAQVDRENYLTVWTLDTNGNAALVGTDHAETRYATPITGSFDQTSSVATLKSLAGTSANDRTTDFTYDKNGRRLTETRLGVSASTVSGTGTLSTSTQDATITYTYNAAGQVLSKTEANGDVATYIYDTSGRLMTTKGATMVDNMETSIRLQTDMKYDGLGNLVRTVAHGDVNAYQADRVTTATYIAGGILSATTDAGGFTHNFGYDAAGRVVKDSYTRTKSDGSTTVTEAIAYRYDAAGRMITQANATWNGSAWVFSPATRIGYDAYGEVTGRGMTASPDDTAVYQETFDYDAGGRLWRTTQGDGTIRILFYDKAGNATLTLSSAGADLASQSYSSAAATLSSAGATSIAGAVTSIAIFDKRGQQTGSRAPDRQLSWNGSSYTSATITGARTYNAFGEVLSETDARSYTTDFSYNAMGRLIQKQSPTVSWTSESGAVATARPTENYYYDVSGRLVGVRDANDNLTTRLLEGGSGHDGADPLVHKEFHADGGAATTWHNVFGDERVLVDELGQSEVRAYDDMGRITSVQHRGSLLTDTYAYDGLGQRIRHYNSQLGSSVVERTDYDALGRVVSEIAYGGDSTTYAYSWSGTLATSGLGTFGGWVKTTTNAAALTMTESLDYFGRTVDKVDYGAHDYAFTFDKAGRLTARTNDAGESLAYSWYNTGLIGQIVSGSSATTTSSYGYDMAGNRTAESIVTSSSVSYQNASATFDALNRTLSITDSGASGSAPMAIAYQYDKAGNVRHMAATYRSLDAQGNIGSTDVGQDYWYSYDAMNRFLVTKGSLSGTAGASGTTVVRGATGTATTYDLAGRRATATTESAGLIWHGYKATLKTNHNVFYYVDIDEAETEETGYTWLQTDVAYSGTTVEHYSYSADGDLSGVTVASQEAHAIWASAPTPDEMGSAVTRATYTRDAMGRVTQLTEYDATGVTEVYSRSAVYDNSSRLTSDTVSTLRSDGDFTTSTTYSYGAGGLLASASADASKGGSDSAVPDTVTTYSYAWWDGAQQSLVTVDPDNSATNTTSTYTYDGSGHIASVAIQGTPARTVSFVTDASGMVLQRTEAVTGTSNQPRELHYYYEGVRVGDVSNNGTSDIDYVASIARQTEAAGTGPFINGHSYATPYADFDQSYDPINGLNVQSTGSSYTVSDGDTLLSIAATVWGDASLWYLIADANGLNSASALISGQSLAIPNKVTNLHNDSNTFRVYDPNKAMGDLSPGAPKPPKAHGCGVVGQILMVAIAVAVTVVTSGAAAAGLGFATSIGGGISALAAGEVGFGAAVAAGAIGGALGSVASQAFGVATGLQNKFSWKGVAMSAISGAIGGGIGKAGGIFAQSGFVGGAARGLAGSLLSQGIGVATGLQNRFDWAGVAGATLGGGLSSAIGGGSLTDRSLRNIATNLAASGASALANAGLRSLANGTDFGDNLLAALPDVIGGTIGNLIGSAMSAKSNEGYEEKSKEYAGYTKRAFNGYNSTSETVSADRPDRFLDTCPPNQEAHCVDVIGLDPETATITQLTDSLAKAQQLSTDVANRDNIISGLTAALTARYISDRFSLSGEMASIGSALDSLRSYVIDIHNGNLVLLSGGVSVGSDGASLAWGAARANSDGVNLLWGGIEAGGPGVSLGWGAARADGNGVSLLWGGVEASRNRASILWGGLGADAAGVSALWDSVRIGPNAEATVTAFATASGSAEASGAQTLARLFTHQPDANRVVLGPWSGRTYINEAVTNGGTYYQTSDDFYARLSGLAGADARRKAWVVNEAFLRQQLERGVARIDFVGETIKHALTDRNSFRAQEIRFLDRVGHDYGYRRQDNSWVRTRR